jgi:hypothetical protein
VSSPTGRSAAKTIHFMHAYSAGEIMIGRQVGQYPLPETDFSAVEQRVLAAQPVTPPFPEPEDEFTPTEVRRARLLVLAFLVCFWTAVGALVVWAN